MSRVRFVFLMVVFMLFGCEKKITNEQFEQNVLSEIFVKVVDSTYQDYRILTSVSEMGERIYDKNGKWIGRSLIGQRERDLKRSAKVEVFKKDSLNLIIAMGTGGLINEKTELQNYNSRKFIFKHLSELPPATHYKDWAAKYPKFVGVLVFSNIKFDASKTNGTLEVSYYCGDRCGMGYIVTIKKVDHKWVISKVEDTWIA
jgi:hypothetical protein